MGIVDYLKICGALMSLGMFLACVFVWSVILAG